MTVHVSTFIRNFKSVLKKENYNLKSRLENFFQHFNRRIKFRAAVFIPLGCVILRLPSRPKQKNIFIKQIDKYLKKKRTHENVPEVVQATKKRGNLKLLQQKCQNRYVFRSVGGWSGNLSPPGMIYYESILMLYSSGLATIRKKRFKFGLWLGAFCKFMVKKLL